MFEGLTTTRQQLGRHVGRHIGRWRSLLVAVLMAGAVAVPTLVQATPASAAPAGFVTRCSQDFCIDGNHFRHVGANTPQLLYQPLWQVQTTLDRLRNAGVRHVRMFLPNTAMAGNKWWPEETYNRLVSVLNEAQARGIYVTLTLSQTYRQGVWANEGRGGEMIVYGDQDFYTRQYRTPEGYVLNMLDDRWIDWGFQLNYRDWVWAFASRLSYHKAIFAWDVANESSVSDGNNGWLVDRHVAFIKNIASLVKAADPNHLVTTGFISTGQAGYTDAQRDRVYNDPNIDYMVIHHYDNVSDRNFYDDVWRAGNRYYKPIIIEETGIAGARGNFQLMKDYFTKAYNTWGVDAVMQWGVEYSCPEHAWPFNGSTWGSGDAIYGPCQQNRIPDYEALWLYWSARL